MNSCRTVWLGSSLIPEEMCLFPAQYVLQRRRQMGQTHEASRLHICTSKYCSYPHQPFTQEPSTLGLLTVYPPTMRTQMGDPACWLSGGNQG